MVELGLGWNNDWLVELEGVGVEGGKVAMLWNWEHYGIGIVVWNWDCDGIGSVEALGLWGEHGREWNWDCGVTGMVVELGLW